MSPKTTKNIFTRAFTVVELMITVGIFAVITSVVLFQNSQFNSSVLLTDLSYQIAMSLRQAQVYGISSKSLPQSFVGAPGVTSLFRVSYGLYFDNSNTTNARQIIFFADIDGDKIYDSGESISITSIGLNNSIKDMCVYLGGSTVPTCGMTSSTVVFGRPNPEPTLKDSAGHTNISMTCIKVGPTNGSQVRAITVSNAGQISVSMNCP